MSIPRIGSPSVRLPTPNLNSALTSNVISLAAGQKWLVPAGQFQLKLGPYSILQVLDPVLNTWVEYGIADDGIISSDGTNYRLVNLTGCVVGALVTTAGTGYTTAPTITPSIGGGTFTSILGGCLSTTITVATAGTGYNHPPSIFIPPPPSGGVQAAATVTVSGGALSTVTVTNVGAGYLTAPTAVVIADPNDTITGQAVLTTAIDSTKATNVTAVLINDPGTAVTSVPTLTITAAPVGGTTAVATAIMMFTVTGLTLGSTGSNYGGTAAFYAYAPPTLVAGTQANANPITGTGLFSPRPFFGYGTTTGAGQLSTTGFVIADGGLHQAVPGVAFFAGTASIPTAYGTATATVGGVTDTCFIQQV